MRLEYMSAKVRIAYRFCGRPQRFPATIGVTGTSVSVADMNSQGDKINHLSSMSRHVPVTQSE